MIGQTGFPGRQEAMMRLEVAISGARLSGKRLLVAMVSLDRFFRVHTVRGSEFGNRVLDIVERRLCGYSLKHAGATVTKLEGHTYLVILHEDEQSARGLQQMEAVKYAVERPIDEEQEELYLTASIGAAYYPNDGLTSEHLICRSEAALHQAKEQGGNRVFFYTIKDTEQQNRRLLMENSLRAALYMRQFKLRFQPYYRMEDGTLRGFQTSIHWEHPELGDVPAEEFIPVAEQSGFIVPIGEWAIVEACKRLKLLKRFGKQELTMSVQLSPLQLKDPAFPKVVLSHVQDHGLQPGALELEVKEPARIFGSTTSLTSLSRLRASGVRIALVDFGTGGASFHNLNQLPIQSVRIDASFVHRIDLQGAERHIVEAIVRLAQKLGLETIAEGVEYKGQFELLKEWGCQYAQGRLLGQPLEASMLEPASLRGALASAN